MVARAWTALVDDQRHEFAVLLVSSLDSDGALYLGVGTCCFIILFNACSQKEGSRVFLRWKFTVQD